MNDILVSVIMPVYNGEQFIGEAIRSVLRQRVRLELIVINDKSTDGTEDVICSFEQDERLIYIRNEDNLGVAKSRNKGMEMAKGKYIAFLDADDYWTEDKLEKQLSLMEEKKAVLSSAGRQLMDEEGSLGKIIQIPEEITYNSLLRSNVLNTSGVMVLADVARKYPMTQDHLHEDYIMWLSILRDYGKAYGINEPMLKYRVMKGTKSANKLKSAKMTFGVYRYMGLNLFWSCWYFCCYAVKGILKYH
ncbi:MAG: glycosyltransferase [Lachnospiraceae bacterium]|nr:glycosyltransferase [Lachnospiraceae bacterium]MDE6626693.1 glycosyltransferase [Lachnospiraceae bacterium]